MADSHQLVFHLLPLGFQLHLIGKRLPSATATDAKMLAERLQTMLGGLYNALDKAFHVILFLLVHLDVHHVSGNGEIYKNYHPVHVGERFAFCGYRFDGDTFENEVYPSSAHRQVNII